jgi:hypothetical protein
MGALIDVDTPPFITLVTTVLEATIMAIHPKFGFKKHGNGIHPPTCF